MMTKYFIFLVCSLFFLSCRTHQYKDFGNVDLTEKEEQSGQRLTYANKFSALISLTEKYPEEEEFARRYSALTESTVALSDTLLIRFLKESKTENSLTYFSRSIYFDTLYQYLVKIRALGKAKTQDLKRKERIDSIFTQITLSKGTTDWIEKSFVKKSMVESVAEFRQIQTNCLDTRDLVFDDMIERLTRK